MADIITVMNLGWRYAAPGGGGEPIQGLRDTSCYVQQGALAGVTEGRVSKVVSKTNRLGQILVD